MKGLWPYTLPKAGALQELLRTKVEIVPLRKTPGRVAGVDAAFTDDTVVAVASSYAYATMEQKEDAVVTEKLRFPYIPGYLTFREGHAVVKAVKKLRTAPDLILVDGQGIAHPKGIGIASHIGVLLGIPAVGCAKALLVGEFKDPGMKKGEWSYISYRGMKVGVALRTRSNVNPLFVSPGHLIDIPSSIEVVMHCVLRYRIPEPLRRADLVSKKFSTAAKD